MEPFIAQLIVDKDMNQRIAFILENYGEYERSLVDIILGGPHDRFDGSPLESELRTMARHLGRSGALSQQ